IWRRPRRGGGVRREAPLRRPPGARNRRPHPHDRPAGGPPGVRDPDAAPRRRPAGQRRIRPTSELDHKGELHDMVRLLAAEGGYQAFTLRGGEWFILIGSALTALLAIAVGFILMRIVLAEDQGTPSMIEIAKAIQEGALAYLKRQFRTIGYILIPLAVIVFVTSVAVEKENGVEALSFAQSGTARTLAFLA